MNLFPSGIAEGEAFCNRVKEREKLASHIARNAHTLLSAPRRYGKTSLIRQVISENSWAYEWVDFLSVTTQEQVEEKILKVGKSLLFKLSPDLIKLSKNTLDFVKSMTPELNLGAMGQSLTLHLTSDQKISIDEMLLEIDSYAQKVGKKGVLVFDEFQQISELPDSHSVEALIRHAVERSKAITYIFSGSNRHLLEEMFSKSTRPLYRLCQVMPIQRIHAEDYEKFLVAAAIKHWGEALSEQAISEILKLTERHSFYVNGLCNDLWSLKTLPGKEEVRAAWSDYVKTNKRIIVSDIASLALNQKKVIQALAESPTSEPYASEFSLKVKLPAGSVRRAFEYLLKKDIAYIDDQEVYRLLDPAVRHYLLS